MKLSVKKIVEKGNELVKYFVDGKESSFGRELTGHTSGYGRELLETNRYQNIEISYGNHRRSFDFQPLNTTDTPELHIELILRRAEQVRRWIDECKYLDAMASGEASCEIADFQATIQNLVQSHRLYYRTSKGQIKQLE